MFVAGPASVWKGADGDQLPEIFSNVFIAFRLLTFFGLAKFKKVKLLKN